MKCKNCGADVVFGNKFCSECGVRLEEFMSPAPGEQQETKSSDTLKANIMSENSYEQTSAVSAQEDTSEEETYYSDSEEENLPEEPPRKKSGFLSVLRRNKAAVIIIVVCLFVLVAVCLAGSSGKRKSDKSDPERATMAETTISRLTAQDIPGTYVGEGGGMFVFLPDGTAEFYQDGYYGVLTDNTWTYDNGHLDISLGGLGYDVTASFNPNGTADELDSFTVTGVGDATWADEVYTRYSDSASLMNLEECSELVGYPIEYQTVRVGHHDIQIPSSLIKNGNTYENSFSAFEANSADTEFKLYEDVFLSVIEENLDSKLDELTPEDLVGDDGTIVDIQSDTYYINGMCTYRLDILLTPGTELDIPGDVYWTILIMNDAPNTEVLVFSVMGYPKVNHDGLLEMVIDSLGGSSYSVNSSSSSSNSSASTSSSNPSGSSSSSSSSNAAVDPEFKALMDSYEEFFDDYIDLMEMYSDPNADYLTMLNNLDQIYQMIEDYPTMLAAVQAIDYNSLSAADYAYYMEVMGRITQKLIAAGYSV